MSSRKSMLREAVERALRDRRRRQAKRALHILERVDSNRAAPGLTSVRLDLAAWIREER